MPNARVSVDDHEVTYPGVRGDGRTGTYVDTVPENHFDGHARPGVDNSVVALRLNSGTFSKKPEYELSGTADRSDQEPGLGILLPIFMPNLAGRDAFGLVSIDQRVVFFRPDVADDFYGNWSVVYLFEEIEQDGDGVVALPQDLVLHVARIGVFSFDRQRLPPPWGGEYTVRRDKAERMNMDLIVNFTPTGMIPTKEMTPHVPVSVSEIVEEVHRAFEIGITMVHLHARDGETGVPTYRAEVYASIIEGIRSFSKDLVLCVSLSGRNFKEFEKRAEPLQLTGDLKPDMGSLTLSSLNFVQHASLNDPEMVVALAREMRRRGIVAELEAFDLGMINYAKYLERKGLIEAPHYCNLLLGNIASAQPDPLHLGTMIRDLPANTLWSVAGLSAAQLPMNAIAIALGGGVRIGLEDNIWFDSGRSRLAANTDLLRRVHSLAQIHERSIMKPAKLREILKLEPGDGRYGRTFREQAADS